MASWLTEQEILAAHHQFGKLNRKMVRIAMGPNWPPDWEYIGIFDDEHDNELRTMGNLADLIRDNHTEQAERCQKCGESTGREEAYVNGQIWCHPCADRNDS